MFRYTLVVLVLVVLVLQVAVQAALPINLITSDGLTSKASSQFEKYMENSFQEDNKVLNRVVGLLDCSSLDNDCKLVNELFGAHFASSASGVSAEVVDNALVLRGCFDRMYSDKFCGSKAVDFLSSLQCANVVVLPSEDIEDSLVIYDQVFRRILTSKLSSEPSEDKKDKLVLVVATSTMDLDQVPNKAIAFLQNMFEELGATNKLSEVLEINVIPVQLEDESSITNAKRTLEEITSGLDEEITKATIANHITSRWSKIPSTPRPILTKIQQQSLYIIEVSYNEILTQVEAAIVQMQRRVSSGKVLAKFPERIKELMTSILNEFNKKVSGTTMVRERGERARMLRDYILSAALRLFDHQVLIKEAEVFRKAKKELVKIYNNREGPSTEMIQNLQRKGLFDFQASMSEIEDESIGLVVSEEKVSEYANKLETLIKDFPESPEAKLIEIKQMEKQVTEKPKKKKRGAAKIFGISLSLVGMLRPPGFGNLQGFIGYATSMFGLPLDLLLGVQNDGDSPEIMGEDREHPILRLQPKINFDIDV